MQPELLGTKAHGPQKTSLLIHLKGIEDHERKPLGHSSAIGEKRSINYDGRFCVIERGKKMLKLVIKKKAALMPLM